MARGLAPLAATGMALILALPAGAARLDLDLTFSPAAQARLDALGERVTVAILYYGTAAKGHEDLVADDGQVPLGREDYDIFARPQTVTVGGSASGIPEGLVQEIGLNVNVFTSRLKDPKNLLDCDVVDEPLATLDGKTRAIACKLIGE